MDYIDLYYMHRWDQLTPLEESLRAFDDLVQAGKVRYIGVSNFKAWQVMKSLALSDNRGWARFVAGQYQYSLIKRDIEYEFIDLYQSERLGLTPWAPLGGGFLSGKYKRGQRPTQAAEGRIAQEAERTEDAWARRNTERNWNIIEAVGEIAEARGASYSQIALAWLRAQPIVSTIIMGVRTMAQLEDNLGAAEIDLNQEELATLNTASLLPELYPYRFIAEMRPRSAD
jgi:aryl-alcohol dehydrogenase-like predicted oxidoreductase